MLIIVIIVDEISERSSFIVVTAVGCYSFLKFISDSSSFCSYCFVESDAGSICLPLPFGIVGSLLQKSNPMADGPIFPFRIYGDDWATSSNIRSTIQRLHSESC